MSVSQYNTWESQSTLPYNFYPQMSGNAAVIYNGELHILGSNNGTYATSHYKWDGTNWTSVSTLPYAFSNGSAVVYNNEIHILGSYGNGTKHYKWNGTNWASVSTIPFDYSTTKPGSAVVYGNAIHLLGGNGNGSSHRVWNGTTWNEVSDFPVYYGSDAAAVVYNNEIHMLGGSNAKRYHYKYDGEWQTVGTLPYDFYMGAAVVYDDKIHILGGASSMTAHYKWDGTDWDSESTLPYDLYRGGAAVVYDDAIQILGGYDSANYTKHYAYAIEPPAPYQITEGSITAEQLNDIISGENGLIEYIDSQSGGGSGTASKIVVNPTTTPTEEGSIWITT